MLLKIKNRIYSTKTKFYTVLYIWEKYLNVIYLGVLPCTHSEVFLWSSFMASLNSRTLALLWWSILSSEILMPRCRGKRWWAESSVSPVSTLRMSLRLTLFQPWLTPWYGVIESRGFRISLRINTRSTHTHTQSCTQYTYVKVTSV